MKQFISTLALAAAASQATPVGARTPAPTDPAGQVVVVTGQADTDSGREFVAGKIIIGRQRIEQSGVRTVEELLKREPSVSVSGDGRIGLLNMPGYTQVLVDGQPPRGGRTSELDLVHVEKIEIVKSSMAEYGPFGIAGTINIVTRKTARKTSTSVKVGARTGGGRTESVSLSHNQSAAGSPLRYSLHLSADQSDTRAESHVRQTLLVPGQNERALLQARATGRSVSRPAGSVGGNLTWQRGADETIGVSPEVWTMSYANTRDETRRRVDGETLQLHTDAKSSFDLFKMPINWSFKPGKTSQVDVALFPSLVRTGTSTTRLNTDLGQRPIVRSSDEQGEAGTLFADVSYKAKLKGGHDLKAGAKLTRSVWEASYQNRLDGLPDPALSALATSRRVFTGERRLFLQDEWRFSEKIAFNAGIAGAETIYDIDERPYRARVRFRSWSPSLHASKKVGDEDQHQLRLSLARSFTTPDEQQYTLRPQINPLAPCAANGACMANTIDTADVLGNTALRPERALGLNLAYEHAAGDDSTVTLELYTRRIDNKIGDAISLESVAWSPQPRYVTRPVNLGDAWTSGLDVELELALRDLLETAPKIALRGSVGLARSRVASLPGPDNRLDKQTPWTAKLGGSYTLTGIPVKIDLNANWSPSAWTRTSLVERVSLPRRAELTGSAIWSLNKEQRLILNVTTRSPRTSQRIDEFTVGAERLRQFTDTQKYNRLSVDFETKL